MKLRERTILYVGDSSTGDALRLAAEAEGAYVYLPSGKREALGLYITTLPHLMVVDMCAPDAAEIVMHLRSVDAAPLILLEAVPSHDLPYGLYSIVRGLPAANLLRVLAALANGDAWPLRYAS